MLREAGLGAAIAGKMRVLKTSIGRPRWMLHNALDCCNAGHGYAALDMDMDMGSDTISPRPNDCSDGVGESGRSRHLCVFSGLTGMGRGANSTSLQTDIESLRLWWGVTDRNGREAVVGIGRAK